MSARILSILILVVSPSLVVAQQSPSTHPTRSSSAATVPQTTAASTKQTFSVTDPDVQRVLRDAAISSEQTLGPADAADRADPPREGLAPLRFRAPRRVDRLKCDGDECVALTADGTELYTVSEDGRFRNNSSSRGDYY